MDFNRLEGGRQDLQIQDYEFGPQQEINLREYWQKIWRRRGTVFAFAAAVFVLTAFWTFIQKPVYTAKGTILIEKEPNILSFEQVLQIETMRDDFYQTQYRLLSGRTLAEDVVGRLKLDQNPEFVGPKEKNRGAARTVIDPKGTVAVEEKAGETGAPAGGAKAGRAAANTNLVDNAFREGLIDKFLARLSVNPVRLTRLVEVSFRAREPQLAADCVNELTDAFIDMNINMKYAATEEATQFLGEQIKSLQSEIEQKAKQLAALEAEANIVALGDKETTIIDRLGELNKALTESQIDRYKKEATYKELRNVTPDFVPEAINNPLIQRLREDYVKLKREYQKMEERFQPSYPELQRAKVEMETARKSLEDETQNLVKGAYSDYQTALKREQSLEAAFNEQKNAAFKMNSSAVQYNGLKLEVENRKTLLDSLLRRQSETGVEARLKGLRTSNVRVVDRARVPVRPSSPRKARNLALALMLGLMGGVGLAFLFDFLDNTVKTSEDVDRYAGLPTLGVVPKFSLEGVEKGYLYYRRKKEHRLEGKRDGIKQLEAGTGSGTGSNLRNASFGDGEGGGGAAAANGGVIDVDAGSAGAGAGTGNAADADGVGGAYGAGAGTLAADGYANGTGNGKSLAVKGKKEQRRTIELIPHFFPNSRLAESYRSIRTALLLSSADQPVKAVAITSALPGEGKTVSVANLAITLAQSGKVVLVVDADLRRPRQHRLFKIKNTFGLTSYLTDSVDLRNVIKPTEIPNLYLVNSGPIPPNPAELLGSEKMAALISILRDKCDFMLFDMPPMLEISDALVLGARIDGIILVVHGDKTSREVLKKTREKLDLLKVKTLGVIINNVDVQRHSYYYKDYYYHYDRT